MESGGYAECVTHAFEFHKKDFDVLVRAATLKEQATATAILLNKGTTDIDKGRVSVMFSRLLLPCLLRQVWKSPRNKQ